MKKVDIDALRRRYDADAMALWNHFFDAGPELFKSPHWRATLSMRCELVFAQSYVLFEGFLSELFVAYLNRDASRYVADFDGRILQSIESKFGSWHASRVALNSPRHIPASELSLLVDPSGRNLTFRNTAELQGLATKWLVGASARKFTNLKKIEVALLDACRAMRNYLGHRSKAAKAEMNSALFAIPASTGLGRVTKPVTSLGAFLKAPAKPKQGRRLLYFMSFLRGLSSRL